MEKVLFYIIIMVACGVDKDSAPDSLEAPCVRFLILPIDWFTLPAGHPLAFPLSASRPLLRSVPTTWNALPNLSLSPRVNSHTPF